MIGDFATRFVFVALYVISCAMCVLGTLQGVKAADGFIAKSPDASKALVRGAAYFGVALLAYWCGKSAGL